MLTLSNKRRRKLPFSLYRDLVSSWLSGAVQLNGKSRWFLFPYSSPFFGYLLPYGRRSR